MNWKWDISILGHFIEALGFAFVGAVIAFYIPIALYELLGWELIYVIAFQKLFMIGAILMFAYYVGREKRDCETGWHDDKGNKMKSGDLRAWYRMWIRPKNILDMLGPFVVMAFAIWNYIYN